MSMLVALGVCFLSSPPQSAKDRSSMELTYEQALILEQQHDIR
jgi:hypothetical protein